MIKRGTIITMHCRRSINISVLTAMGACFGGCSGPTTLPSDAELSQNLNRHYAEYNTIITQCVEHPSFDTIHSTATEPVNGPIDQYGILSSAERDIYNDIQTELDGLHALSVTCIRYPPGPGSRLLAVAFEFYFDHPANGSVYLHKDIEYDYGDEPDTKTPGARGVTATGYKHWFIYTYR